MNGAERFLVILVILSMASMSCAIFPDNNQASIRVDRYLYRIYDPNSGKFGYIDNQGNVVIRPQFDDGQESFNDLGWIELDEVYHYINKSGKTVIHTTYNDEVFDYGSGDFHEGMALIEVDEGLIGMNRKGETVFFLPNWCSLEGKFSEGLAFVTDFDQDNWGFINMTGEMEIGPISDQEMASYGCDFHEGLIPVVKNGALGYMDKNGEMRIEFRFSYASDFFNGTAVIGLKDEKEREEYFIVNTKGEILKKLEQRWDMELYFSEGMCAVSMHNKYGVEKIGFIDKEFKLIIEPKFDWFNWESGFIGGIVYVADIDSGRQGYINKKGEWIYNWDIGRDLNFIFRDTTNQELIQTIESFGAVPLKGRYLFLSPADPVRMGDEASRTWVYKEGEKGLFRIGLENNMRSAEVGLTIEDASKWRKFEIDLWGDTCSPRILLALCTSAALYVHISYGNIAEQALREFALHVLKAHPGGVCDYDHDHAWTIEEIRSNSVIKGVTFLRQLKKPKK